VPRALTLNRTVVPAPDRERFLTRARVLRTHFQSRGCQYWVFEDADLPGAYIEFAEAADANTLEAAHASVALDSLELGGDIRRNMYREVTL
jgi:hypothetical protein